MTEATPQSTIHPALSAAGGATAPAIVLAFLMFQFGGNLREDLSAASSANRAEITDLKYTVKSLQEKIVSLNASFSDAANDRVLKTDFTTFRRELALLNPTLVLPQD